MRAMELPDIEVSDVLGKCLSGASDGGAFKDKFTTGVSSEISRASIDYNELAQRSELYLVPPNNCPKDTIVLSDLTKKELISLYSSYMVPSTKPAREVYDKLKQAAPNGKCPFCGFGHAETLDHYLPKSAFPLLSIAPQNLVPACRTCNTEKLTGIASSLGEQCLHPYYDGSHFISDRWLHATVRKTSPATLDFFINTPSHWLPEWTSRVESHFRDFKLSARYKIESSEELATVREQIRLNPSWQKEDIRQHLLQLVQVNENTYLNSWKTATYHALSENDWYLEGGYNF